MKKKIERKIKEIKYCKENGKKYMGGREDIPEQNFNHFFFFTMSFVSFIGLFFFQTL